MKKMILTICVVMIGSILVLTSNSFASREMQGHHHGRGGHYQNWHKQAYYKHGWAWGNYHKLHRYRPAHDLRYKHYRWHLRPIFRHSHHRWFQHPEIQEINYYYGNTESYAESEDEFNASASVSDTGFSLSVGVKRTD